MSAEVLDRLCSAVLEGNEDLARSTAQEALDKGIDPLEAIQEGGAKGLDILGKRFQSGEAYLPELMLAAEAMKASLAVLMPKLSQDRSSDYVAGKVVIGTVWGDVHDIGKALVATMLTVSGFDVYDLGINVPSAKFIEKAKEVGANIIALSSLMTTSAYYHGDVINRLKETGDRDKFYVVVGGGPITADFAKEIGADGYAKFATGAAQLCKRLVKEAPKPPLTNTMILY